MKLTPLIKANILPSKEKKEGLCMLGGIYSDQRCPVCGGVFRDDGKKGLFCEKHPGCGASRFKVKLKYKGKEVLKRFGSYEAAQRFLTGLRFHVDEGTLDPRDYRKDNPLGFENLALAWLKHKEKEGVSSVRKLTEHMARAMTHWGNMNIKQIGYAEIEDFLFSDTLLKKKTRKTLSDKTRDNIKATLHSFWVWLRKRRVLSAAQIPEFPEVRFELKWRKLVDVDTQEALLEEIRHLTYHINPKIWIGIKWLTRYISIRPIELLHIREEDFNLSLGVVNIRHNKERKPKIIPLLDEDVQLVKSLPRGLPHLYFFRHEKRKGVHADKRGRFGKDYLYKWWKVACKNLGVEGVDLYGGTRHSSATALREHCSPEQIKGATMHSTNAAFQRYFTMPMEDVRAIYAKTGKPKKGKGEVVEVDFQRAEHEGES
jgi:integrase